MVHSYGAHSPSRVVVDRLRLLGSDNSRLGLHCLTKRYSIVLSTLTQQGEPKQNGVQWDSVFVLLFFACSNREDITYENGKLVEINIFGNPYKIFY